MQIVRLARSGGGQAALYPEGVTRAEDVNVDLHLAFTHANMVIGWQENLPPGEMPPEWMWAFPEELEAWFEEVRIAREQKFSSKGDDSPQDYERNALLDD